MISAENLFRFVNFLRSPVYHDWAAAHLTQIHTAQDGHTITARAHCRAAAFRLRRTLGVDR